MHKRAVEDERFRLEEESDGEQQAEEELTEMAEEATQDDAQINGEYFGESLRDPADETAPVLTKEEQIAKAKEYQEKMERRGVVYLARIPPGLTIAKTRRFFEKFKVERIYFKAENESRRMERKKAGANAQRRYTEGWIEFQDKQLAKFVAQEFNGERIAERKKDQHYDDFWSLRYLPKFKWDNLVELSVAEKEERKKKIQLKVRQAKQDHDEYLGLVDKSKQIRSMLVKKARQIVEAEGGNAKDDELVNQVISERLAKQSKKTTNSNSEVQSQGKKLMLLKLLKEKKAATKV